MEISNLNQKMKPHAILVALPLQGHVIPSVQLAIKLASKGFSITFINAENIHHQITLSNPDGSDDIFAEARSSLGLDIDYMTVSDGLPLEFDRSLNHDQWVGANIYAFPAHVEVAVAKIVRSRPSACCLIADSYSVWASKLAKKFGLFHVSFWTEAAMVLDCYFHLHLLKENGHIGYGSSALNDDIIDYIPGIKSIKRTDLPSYLQEEDLTTIPHQCVLPSIEVTKQADFILANTVQELEDHSIEAIQVKTPIYAIGPLFPPDFTKNPVASSLWAESDCIHWLDSKPPGSVLYVSFGSYAHLSKEELEEIASGIKLSGVNFLWVMRPDMVSSDEPDPLPLGYRNEVGDRGMIVTWTNQRAVLCHRAIGGFLTHCGWNSALESVWCEVPLLCFPLLTDQFTNRKLMVEHWKFGCNLSEEKAVTKEEVMLKIKGIISGSMGYELRNRIKDIKQVLQKAMMNEGSSQQNVDSFIEDLNRATKKKFNSSYVP